MLDPQAIMTFKMLQFSSPCLCAALLVGCAGDAGRYPSLAVRDAERFQGQFAVSEPDPAPPIRPLATPQDVAQIIQVASDSHQEFVNARPGARRFVSSARGATVESYAYTSALIALSDLTSLRSQTAAALGDLDVLAANSEITFAPYDEVAAARARVSDLVGEQDRVLADLWEELER